MLQVALINQHLDDNKAYFYVTTPKEVVNVALSPQGGMTEKEDSHEYGASG